MWVSDKWKDYELIDCSSGERLERWGKQILVRPDPQVIWKPERKNPSWNRLSARYTQSEGGDGHWENHKLPSRWEINYGELTFNVKPMNFKHTGIFPEQACNWDYAMQKIGRAGRKINVLNLFAYTGAATVACAKAGAEVCHVDASKGMVSWAKENSRSSDLENAPVRWIVDDCAKFVEREIRRGRKYDALIMDPPSFGRGPSGEVWKLEGNLWDFLDLCSSLLSDEPLFLIINTYTNGLSPSLLGYICQSVLGRKFGGHTESAELGLPVTDSGLILPCGSSCRWEMI